MTTATGESAYTTIHNNDDCRSGNCYFECSCQCHREVDREENRMTPATSRYSLAFGVLELLLAAASDLGRDVPDHKCFPTEHEAAFWQAQAAAAQFVRAVYEAERLDNETESEKRLMDGNR